MFRNSFIVCVEFSQILTELLEIRNDLAQLADQSLILLGNPQCRGGSYYQGPECLIPELDSTHCSSDDLLSSSTNTVEIAEKKRKSIDTIINLIRGSHKRSNQEAHCIAAEAAVTQTKQSVD